MGPSGFGTSLGTPEGRRIGPMRVALIALLTLGVVAGTIAPAAASCPGSAPSPGSLPCAVLGLGCGTPPPATTPPTTPPTTGGTPPGGSVTNLTNNFFTTI